MAASVEKCYARAPPHITFQIPHPNPPNVDEDCTEKIPWLAPIDQWTDPCPHGRANVNLATDDGAGGYQRGVKHCEERATNICFGFDDDEPSTSVVCEDHIEDSQRFLQIENLYQAHRVGVCSQHRALLKQHYPKGLNTCQCHLLLDRWQCRRCFKKKVLILQHQFRRRVMEVGERGGVTEDMLLNGRTDHETYHHDWKHVRRMVALNHPCHRPGYLFGPNRPSYDNHINCGHRRLIRSDVLDCRACGGQIIPSSREENVAKRARMREIRKIQEEAEQLADNRKSNTGAITRSRRAGSGALMELDHRGRGVRVGAGTAEATEARIAAAVTRALRDRPARPIPTRDEHHMEVIRDVNLETADDTDEDEEYKTADSDDSRESGYQETEGGSIRPLR